MEDQSQDPAAEAKPASPSEGNKEAGLVLCLGKVKEEKDRKLCLFHPALPAPCYARVGKSYLFSCLKMFRFLS